MFKSNYYSSPLLITIKVSFDINKEKRKEAPKMGASKKNLMIETIFKN